MHNCRTALDFLERKLDLLREDYEISYCLHLLEELVEKEEELDTKKAELKQLDELKRGLQFYKYVVNELIHQECPEQIDIPKKVRDVVEEDILFRTIITGICPNCHTHLIRTVHDNMGKCMFCGQKLYWDIPDRKEG